MSSTTLSALNLTSDMPAIISPSPLSSITSTYGRILASASNATWSMNPSPRDLLLVVPRMMAQVGSFAMSRIPGRIVNSLRPGIAGSVIAEATGNENQNMVSAALSGISAQETAAAAAAASLPTAQVRLPDPGLFSQSFGFQQLRNLGGIFTYMTSKWALTCFALVSFGDRVIVVDLSASS